MKGDFTRLEGFIKGKEDIISGKMFSIYHKWDFASGKVEYTSGIPVRTIPNAVPAELKVGEIPATKVYTLRHNGPYKHLGNAWSAMYNMHRAKAIKVVKGIHPFEVYENKPGEVPDKDLITKINFAVQ